MSLGTFQKETLTLKISKQPEHEATSQVKSKLENSTTAYASVLVPAGPFLSCAGHAAAKGTESANVLGLWVRGGCSPLNTGSVCPSGCSYCQGIWVLGRRLHTGRRGRSPQAPTPGTSTCLQRQRGQSQGQKQAGPSPPRQANPTAASGPAGLLFFLIPMLMLTRRPHCFSFSLT